MSIFDFLSGQFIDVIHWTDDRQDRMVWRFERHGHEIKYGAKLTVREGQAAVFVHEGQLADVFTPGLYLLETNNLPILTTLQHWDHGFRSPFKSEIYFVNTTRFTDLKWGTKNPVMLRDPEFGPTRVRAFGTYAVKVADPALFLTEIVGTDGEFTADEITFQIRNVIVQEASRTLAASGIPVLDMAANTADLGKLIASEISKTVAAYGLSIPELYIENISLPAAVEAALDKRTSMGVVGDLGRFTQYQAAEALTAEGSTAGAALGTGFGAGMGMQMGGMTMGPWGQRPAAPPPPPPVEHVWHIAKDGATTGPFSTARLGRMATDGDLTRDSLVWTQGQDGWMRAEDVPDLTRLFTVMPPPPAERMIEGHCDCGGVAVRLAKAPNRINACPCGYCRQIGAQWSYFKPANVTVTGQTHGYTRAAHRIDFRRCATCGTLICWQPRGGDMSVMGVHMLLFPEKLRAGIPLTGDPLWDGAK